MKVKIGLSFILVSLILILMLYSKLVYAENQGIVSVTILPRCSLNLKPGWNLISVCVNKTGNVNDIFDYSKTKFRYILRWKWNGSHSEFEIYSPRAVSNSFNTTNLNESYFILVYNENDLGYAGKLNQNLSTSMFEGWNAPSWPYEFSTNITKYFNPSKHRYLMKWNKQIQLFEIYSPRAISNPFSKIFMGEGQFIYAYFNHTLFYNRNYLSS